MFLSAKIRNFSAIASTFLKLIQRDLSVCWLFTSTFPTPTDFQPTHCSVWLAANKSSAWL